MARTAENSLKQAETIALNQGSYKTELAASNQGLYRFQLKQSSSLSLQLKSGSNTTVELIQDRNGDALINPGEVLKRSGRLKRAHSLRAEGLKQGTYFVQVKAANSGINPAISHPTYQLSLSTSPQTIASTRSGYSSWGATHNSGQQSDEGYQYLFGDLLSNLLGRNSSSRWNGSFINRTTSTVNDYDSYNFSRPTLAKDLGARGKSGKTLARLKLDYGTRSPGSGIQSDNYAMQAWTKVSLKEGKFYQVKSDSNDGTRFFFRDRKTGKVVTSLNGDWRGNSTNPWTQLLSVAGGEGGSYDFYVQHYDRTGTSSVDVKLEEVQPAGKVIASTLNLRSQPSTVNNAPIEALASGTSLKILRQVQSSNDSAVPDWYQVTTSNGKQGYVAAQSNLVQLNGSSADIVNFGDGTSSNSGGNSGGGNSSGGIQGGGTGSVNPRPTTGGGGSSDGKTNSKGVSLIKSFEGLRLDAYRDPVGVWTIGYGTTSGVKAGMQITAAKAEQYLREDLNRFEQAVKNDVKVSLNSDQFSALVSFTYNVGEGAFAGSTLLRKLNQSDYQGAADELLRWNKGDGQVLAGLTRRRNAERAMFLGQDYTAYL